MSERERPSSLLDASLAMGALVTIATGGALIGLGMQSGEPSRVFRLVGRALLERSGVTSTGAPLTSVALGYLHHLVVATVWGAIIGLIVLPLRGINRVLAAVGITLLYIIVASRWLPPAMRIGFAVTANVPGAVPIAVALLVAVLGGIWLAATETTA